MRVVYRPHRLVAAAAGVAGAALLTTLSLALLQEGGAAPERQEVAGQAKGQPKEASPPDAGTGDEEEEVHIKGDHWRYDGKTKVSEFWGNVEATQGDTKFTCEKIVYNEETEKGICSGEEIRVTDPEGWATAVNVEFDTKEKVASLGGDVVIVYIPEEGQESEGADDEGGDSGGLRSQIEGKVTITCDRADYFYKEKVAECPGGVTMRDKERTLTADSVSFDRNTEIAVLVGNVRVVDKKDRVMTATKVEASFAEDDEWIVGENVTWTGKIEEEEEEEQGQGAEGQI